MSLFKSANPALSEATFRNIAQVGTEEKVMTISGTVNKTAFLLFLTMASAFYTWNLFFTPPIPSYMNTLVIGGSIVGFILAMVIIFNKTMAGTLAPIYAVCKGVALGGLSAYMEAQYPGIATQAIALTFSIFLGLLLLYRLQLIRVTENFKMMVGAATLGVFFFYLIAFVLRMFGMPVALLHSGSTGSIILSLVIIAIASANLVVDFDFIEKGAEQRAPKYMEWYGAFGLLVTLVWLYIEILRLLAKMRSR